MIDIDQIAEEEFKRDVQRELVNLRDDPQTITLEIGKIDAWILFQSLQLLLKHTEIEQMAIARRVVADIASLLEEILATNPPLKEMARRGREES